MMFKILITQIKNKKKEEAISLIEKNRKNHNELSKVDNSGRSALHWAAIKNDDLVFKKLLEHLPNDCTGVTDNYGMTPIHIAAAKNHPKIIKSFIDKYGGMITQSTDNGGTVLHIAAVNGSWEVIQQIFQSLTEYPQDTLTKLINQRDNNGTNPLGTILLNYNDDNMDIINLFLSNQSFKINEYLNNKKGMDIFASERLLDIGGFNVLHYALKEKLLGILNILIERQGQYHDVNFFYPAQNPMYHMCSPNKILEKVNHTKRATSQLSKLLEQAQTQQEVNEYTDGDSDLEDSNAYVWKHVLLDMVEAQDVVKQKDTYVSPLFHGVPFMTNLYTYEDSAMVAKKLLSLNPGLKVGTKQKLTNGVPNEMKAIYSRTSTASAGVANLTVPAQDDGTALIELKAKNDILKQNLIDAYKADSSDHKAEFQGIVLDFVNKYKDKNGDTQREVWDGIEELNGKLSNDIVKYRFPFISTTKTPDHAVPYGFGLRLEDARGEGRLYPEYNDNGKPKYRLAGLVYIINEDVMSIEKQISSGEIFDVCSLKGPTGKGPNNQFANQIEVAYLGGVSSDKVLAVVPLVYPNFSKSFKEGYHDTVYGYTKQNYNAEASYVKERKTISENRLKNIFIKYIDKIANKFSDGILVTLFPKDGEGNFKFSIYDVSTDYSINGDDPKVIAFDPPKIRNTSLNHGMLTAQPGMGTYVSPQILKELTFEGRGMSDYKESNYWQIYTKIAMDNLLQLRLKAVNLEKSVETFSPPYVFDGSNNVAKKLAQDISTKVNDSTLLVKVNLYNKHWVGIAIDKSSGEISLHYMDSEQQEMPSLLKEKLTEVLIKSHSECRTNIIEKEVELQKYNNCGLEVIENLMQHVTGYRLSQEDALPVHALLFEDSLMLAGDLSYQESVIYFDTVI